MSVANCMASKTQIYVARTICALLGSCLIFPRSSLQAETSLGITDGHAQDDTQPLPPAMPRWLGVDGLGQSMAKLCTSSPQVS